MYAMQRSDWRPKQKLKGQDQMATKLSEMFFTASKTVGFQDNPLGHRMARIYARTSSYPEQQAISKTLYAIGTVLDVYEKANEQDTP